MTIPDFQSIMLPLLDFTKDQKEHSLEEIWENMCKFFKLTEEEKNQILPSGQQTRMGNRTAWAATYLKKAFVLNSPRRGIYIITQRGLDILKQNPQRIDIKYLEQFPEFVEFRTIKEGQPSTTNKTVEEKEMENITPDEQIENGFNSIQASLGQDLLNIVRKYSPAFFEKFVLKLLENMGYGKGEVTGKSGDGGIDGFIYQDKLGLDKILFQAKRFGEDTPISISMIRDFIGTLAINEASKGVFITSSRFPKDAETVVARSQKPIKLIDGTKLVRLMIEFNIGISVEKTYERKRIDSDFFDE